MSSLHTSSCQSILHRSEKKISMLAGLEPTRDEPKRFRIVHLNHSVTAPFTMVIFTKYIIYIKWICKITFYSSSCSMSTRYHNFVCIQTSCRIDFCNEYIIMSIMDYKGINRENRSNESSVIESVISHQLVLGMSQYFMTRTGRSN